MADLRIGTSGWSYDHWRGRFYPAELSAGEWLAYYAARFDCVEINNSFYRLPTEETLVSWREQAPDGFLFAAKASRYLTHIKKLKEPENALERFLPRIELLGETLGPILFQLPPHWHLNLERLEAFLSVLPTRHRYVFEFRDPSWHVEAVYRLLERYRAAFCIYDLAGFATAPVVTTDFAYVRLHGPMGAYQGSYSTQALGAWAAQIRTWSEELAAVHVYFDNDERGYAPRDALQLKGML